MKARFKQTLNYLNTTYLISKLRVFYNRGLQPLLGGGKYTRGKCQIQTSQNANYVFLRSYPRKCQL